MTGLARGGRTGVSPFWSGLRGLAVVLAAIGVFLVINYAQNADERALAGMKTDNIYVATSSIPVSNTARNPPNAPRLPRDRSMR